MFRPAANLVIQFTEAGEDPVDRLHAAADAGFDAVEIWGWSHLDRPAFRRALDETGVSLLSLVVEPALNITDPATHEEYLRGVRTSLDAALELGSPHLVAVSGAQLEGVPRADQHAALVDVLGRAAEIVAGSGVDLILENLNTKLDHVGVYLDTTAETLEIIREVGRPELRMLFDAYHALMMGEDIVTELTGSIDLVGHVQLADLPGRHEPGTGEVDWHGFFRDLYTVGWRGAVGLEYFPATETVASARHVRQVLDELATI